MIDISEIDRRARVRARVAAAEAQSELEKRNIEIAIRQSGLSEILKGEGLVVHDFHIVSGGSLCPDGSSVNRSGRAQAHLDIVKPDDQGGVGISAEVDPRGRITFIAGAGILPWSYKHVTQEKWRGNPDQLRISLRKAMKHPGVYLGGDISSGSELPV